MSLEFDSRNFEKAVACVERNSARPPSDRSSAELVTWPFQERGCAPALRNQRT